MWRTQVCQPKFGPDQSAHNIKLPRRLPPPNVAPVRWSNTSQAVSNDNKWIFGFLPKLWCGAVGSERRVHWVLLCSAEIKLRN